MNSANKPKNAIDLNKFGLESSESEAIPDVETVGFSSGGYRPTNRNELFAGEEVISVVCCPYYFYCYGNYKNHFLFRTPNHGGSRSFSYHNLCYLACGMVFSRPV